MRKYYFKNVLYSIINVMVNYTPARTKCQKKKKKQKTKTVKLGQKKKS